MSEITTYDHVERGLDRITFALRRDNFQKYLETFLELLQNAEDDIISFAKKKDVFTVTGYWLDQIGDLVGEPRNNRDDESYRIAILFKISLNTADGTPDNMSQILSQFTSANKIEIREGYPAFGQIYVDAQENVSSDIVFLVQDIKPAATRWVVHSDFYSNAFRFAWELNTIDYEQFFVTENGVDYEVFQVTLDGVNYEDFLVNTGQGIQYFGPSLSDKNYLYWELPSNFQVTEDGINYEDFIVNGTPFKIQDYTLGDNPDNVTPFTWGIDETTKEITV